MADYNKYLEDVFALISWLKKVEEGSTIPLETWLNRDSEIDYKTKQLAYSEKQQVTTFFESIIDQPAFNSNDHLRLRRMIIDWYSGIRTSTSQLKNNSDPFNLTTEALNEMIRSFGFPYPHKIVSNNLKAQFLLEVVDLYKSKGTPKILVTALQTYFGLSNIVLSEWWIHRDATGSFIARSKPIYPRSMRTNPDMIAELTYSSFIRNDPLWRLSESDLTRLYSESQITLPSLTSQLSLQGTIDISIGLKPALAILNRKLQESYEFWLANETMNRDIHLSRFTSSVSLLELVIGISYCFQSYSTIKGEKYNFYNGIYSPLDVADDDGNRDDIDDAEYGLIIDEYNNLSVRPKTKTERETNLTTRYAKFSDDINDQSVTSVFIRDSTANIPGYNVTAGYGFDTTSSELGIMLNRMNPDFKTEIDEYVSNGGEVRNLINYLLMDLEFHLMYTMEIMKYPISTLIIGSPITQHLEDVIDFFKPIRARIRDFSTIMAINDPLADSQLEDDAQGTMIIRQNIVEEGNWADEVFDQGLVIDSTLTTIGHTFEDELYTRDSTADDDLSMTKITQTIIDEPIVTEECLIQMSQIFIDRSNFGLDHGLCVDGGNTINLINNPNGIENGFEVIIYKDEIETAYNTLPEVVQWLSEL